MFMKIETVSFEPPQVKLYNSLTIVLILIASIIQLYSRNTQNFYCLQVIIYKRKIKFFSESLRRIVRQEQL